MSAQRYRSMPRPQRGAVLFIAIVFLVIVTLLALTAMRTSQEQERLTGGMRSSQLAAMGAESALRNVEFSIWSSATRATSSAGGLPITCSIDGTGGCFEPDSGALNPAVQAFRTAFGWIEAGSLPISVDLANADLANAALAKNPRYILERIGQARPPGPQGRAGGGRLAENGSMAGDLTLFRITARSAGGNPSDVAVRESTFVLQVPASINPN